MNSIVLPSEEETSVTITVSGTTATIDIFDHQGYMSEAYRKMQVLGESSTKVFSEIMRDIYREKHHLNLSISSTMILMAKLEEIEEELKKKFSCLQEPSDSTGSTTNPNPSENSESLSTPEPS